MTLHSGWFNEQAASDLAAQKCYARYREGEIEAGRFPAVARTRVRSFQAEIEELTAEVARLRARLKEVGDA